MKRHELDLTSLLSGAIFTAVGVVFLIDISSDYSVRPRWIVALVLLGLGVAGLATSFRPQRSAPPAVAEASVPAASQPADAEDEDEDEDEA